MMNRRKAMTTLAGARLLAPLLDAAGAGAQQEGTAAAGVTKELDRLSKRVYSEEGIPMFLVCENVAGKGGGATNNAPADKDLNRIVAPAFRRYAAEWERMHPNASSADVAKIVEFLADRDFAQGGKEKTL